MRRLGILPLFACCACYRLDALIAPDEQSASLVGTPRSKVGTGSVDAQLELPRETEPGDLLIFVLNAYPDVTQGRPAGPSTDRGRWPARCPT